MKSALIIGGDSTIGSALHRKLLARGVEAYATSRRRNSAYHYLDLADDPVTWQELPRTDIAYICAATTKLDECEKDPAGTARVNVEHMSELSQRLQANGTHVIFLSTNQVFDGEKPFRTASEAPSPRNEYGRQKAAFEKALLASDKSAAVLRLTKVIAAPLPLLAHWEIALKNAQCVEAFDDLRFAPLPLSTTLEALVELGQKQNTGIFHLSGSEDISYAGIARALAKRIGADEDLVKPISATTKGIPQTFLPKHGTLETSFPALAIAKAETIIFETAA